MTPPAPAPPAIPETALVPPTSIICPLMTTLRTGEIAPDFALSGDDGNVVRLSDLRGSKVVLFFYPRADTPGCTIEACEFRDHGEEFASEGVILLGVSPDTVKDVRAFREKFQLQYRLLADADHAVAEKYGVWREKSMFGRTFWGVVRTTFIIDEEGRISRIYEKVDPAGHAIEVLREL
jgi:thioredoxin-dependent peroxiredoxin